MHACTLNTLVLLLVGSVIPWFVNWDLKEEDVASGIFECAGVEDRFAECDITRRSFCNVPAFIDCQSTQGKSIKQCLPPSHPHLFPSGIFFRQTHS
jgi:hypothetical protein